MSRFPTGTSVQSNQAYIKKFGRRVVGKTVERTPAQPEAITLVDVHLQEGNALPIQKGMVLLMMTSDLEEYICH